MSVLGLGIDAVEIDRIVELMGAHSGRFLARCFRSNDLARQAVDNTGPDETSVASSWAVKEALLKALGTRLRRLPYRDVELVADEQGGMKLILHREVREAARGAGVQRSRVDVCRAGRTVIAVVILED